MRRLGFLAGALVLAAGAAAAAAETVVLTAVERGAFAEHGWYELGPDAAYPVGRDYNRVRAVFVFDLGGITEPVASAVLRLWNPADGVDSPDRRERVAVYAVSSDPGRLVWTPTEHNVALQPEPARETFWDLGTGQRLGSAVVRAGRAGFVEIPLAHSALRVLSRAEGAVALGVTGESLRRTPDEPPIPLELAFANTGGSVPPPELVLETTAGSALGGSRTLHVAARDGARSGDGSRGAPFPALAPALDLATSGDVVEVAPGRYVEPLIMKRGVDVRGSGSDRTILDAGFDGLNLRCADASLEAMYVSSRIVDCSNGTSPSFTHTELPVVYLEDSRATIQGSSVGSIIGNDASPTVVESEIVRGAFLEFLSPSAPFVFERNHIQWPLQIQCDAPTGNRIVGNLFGSPSIIVRYGGISFSGSGDLGLIASNTFVGTQGIRLERVLGEIPDCPPGPRHATIANNILAFGGTGVSLDAFASATIIHNNVFENRLWAPSDPSRNYVGLADPTGSDGNVSVDPRFDEASWLAGLAPDSPLVDAGASELAATELDLDGGPRLVDGTGVGAPMLDIGAQEFDLDYQPALAIGVIVEESFDVPQWPGLASRSAVRVAVRSTPDFDAVTEVNPRSLRLAPLGLSEGEKAGSCRGRDLDRDDRADLLCRFPAAMLRDHPPRRFTKRFVLTGTLRDGTPIRGFGSVRMLALPESALR